MRDPHVRLTEEEQRRLEALEAALTAEDPDLARRLRSGRRVPVVGVVMGGPPSRGLLGVVLVVIGAVVALASVLVSVGVALAGCVAFALGAYLVLTCDRVARLFRTFDGWFLPRFFRETREPQSE